MSKLDVKAFGLACGIVWGVVLFLLGIFAMLWGWGMVWVKAIASFYLGYQATIFGSIIGAVWGFFDAGIGALLVAWLYNKLAK